MTEENKPNALDKPESIPYTLKKDENIPHGNRCTCKDEFVIEPCPVHGPLKQAQHDFGQNKMVITDEFLVSETQGFWQGFIFMCPVCKQPAVMVNPSMGRFCCNCGQGVTIQSRHITNYIRNQYQYDNKEK